MDFVELPSDRKSDYCSVKKGITPISCTGLSTLLPVQNTTASILHLGAHLQYCTNIVIPTSDLTYHPNTTSYTNPISLVFGQSA